VIGTGCPSRSIRICGSLRTLSSGRSRVEGNGPAACYSDSSRASRRRWR
jgi:hypothetical protein